MRGWRHFLLGSAAALVTAAGLTASSQATELWDPPLRGVAEGIPTGAALPPGVYGILNNYWASYKQYDNNGDKTGVKLDALVEVPILYWQTGYQVLGTELSMAIAQPFDYTNVRVKGVAALSDNGHWGTFNTVIIPAQLHWSFPEENLHVMAGLAVYADNATSSPSDPPGGGGVGSGSGCWTLEPNLGISWLSDGWNASLHMRYVYNFKNPDTHYKSGQMVTVDYTLTKTMGKWTIGLGMHEQHQITDDTGSGAAGCIGGCRVTNLGMGPIVGYQFGSLALHLVVNQNIYTKNDVAGTFVNLRLISPL